tara:strand:+ start:420 stop:1286 length:867 start_codon:yes stop_codon:yes gene_type:complete
MVTTRIIGVVNVLNNIAVQSINFNKYLPIGKPEIAISFLNSWGIDEILVLDIKGYLKEKTNMFASLPDYVANCHVPIAAGGGVKSLTDIEKLIRHGADKVVINSKSYENPKILEEGVKEFGQQAIIVSIDVRNISKKYVAFSKSGSKRINKSFESILKQAEEYGAGEIIINSIDKDGSKTGYDINLFDYVKKNVSIPVIGCGGVGTANHFLSGMKVGLSGLAAGNFFHFTEHSVIQLKRYLVKNKHNIRLDTYADYNGHEFSIDSRLSVLNEKKLDSLRYDYIPQEKI